MKPDQEEDVYEQDQEEDVYEKEAAVLAEPPYVTVLAELENQKKWLEQITTNQMEVLKLVTETVPNAITKEFEPVKAAFQDMIDAASKKETSKLQTFMKNCTSSIEKCISESIPTAVDESIESYFDQKALNNLKQEEFKSGLETLVIHAFEKYCKTIFEHADAKFQKEMAEHSNAAQQLLDSSQSSLANTLAVKDVAVDPAIELFKYIVEGNFEEALKLALQKSGGCDFSWLCSQFDLKRILTSTPIPVSQALLLSLLHRLAVDVDTDTDTLRKIGWMTDIAAMMNRLDEMIKLQISTVFEEVNKILVDRCCLPTVSRFERSRIKILLAVMKSEPNLHRGNYQVRFQA